MGEAHIMISFQTRFKIALILTFFPCLVLYPLKYPSREMITLVSWLLPFPSLIGGLCVLSLPMMLSETYGYYSFNAICCILTIVLMRSVVRCREFNAEILEDLHHFARLCVIVTIIISAIQNVTNAALWMHLFPGVTLSSGRGAGFRTEPASISGPFVIYLSLLVICIASKHKDQVQSCKHLIVEGIVASLSILLVTRSIRTLIIICCFIPIFVLNARYLVFFAFGLVATFCLFAERLSQDIKSSTTLVGIFTYNANSWRSMPDIALITNWNIFLLPTDPSIIRDKLTSAIISTFGLERFWLKNTYSTFAASVVSFGLIATAVLLLVGLKDGINCLSRPIKLLAVWLMLYIIVWFSTPKFEAGGWIALGFIVFILRSSTSTEMRINN
jgi:hypothetical protein